MEPPAKPLRAQPQPALDAGLNGAPEPGLLRGRSGVLPRQRVRDLIRSRQMVRALDELDEGQLQPSSLDLRIGRRAWRVRASFLPGAERKVQQQIDALKSDEVDLSGGAVLERNCVYIVELLEHLKLPESVAATANPKSSTGRLDIFTRLIADHAEIFDAVPGGYEGPLYMEISPRSFSVRVRTGSRLNQIRFRLRNSQQNDYTDFRLSDAELAERHAMTPLVNGPLIVRHGLVVRVDLAGELPGNLVGYRAQRYTDVVDVDRIADYDIADFWEPIRARADGRLILDPNQFYILASKQRMQIPADLAAEMVPIDPAMGEFRVHYAGFFDPGFGLSADGTPGSRAVLEVRSLEVPFVLEDSQMIGRLVYERMTEAPDALYGAGGTSNYQGQGLKLSKHFKT